MKLCVFKDWVYTNKSNFCISNHCVEQNSRFSYLQNGKDFDIDCKLHTSQMICSTIIPPSRNKTRRKTKKSFTVRCTKKTTIRFIQRFQNVEFGEYSVVRSHQDIHWDLGITTIAEEIKRYAGKNEVRLYQHINTEVWQSQLLDNENQVRLMKGIKLFELI